MSLTPQPDPFLWVNNVNTTLQEDMRGVPQNIAYYDADDGYQLGPTDAAGPWNTNLFLSDH